MAFGTSGQVLGVIISSNFAASGTNWSPNTAQIANMAKSNSFNAQNGFMEFPANRRGVNPNIKLQIILNELQRKLNAATALFAASI